MRLALAFLIVPAIGLAAPPKLTTAMSVNVEGGAATFKIDAKLDACWKKPTRVKARVTIENGKITAVEFLENSQPRTAVCLKKALLAATTDAPANVVATIDLDGQQAPAPILESKDRKKIDRVLDRNLSTSLAKFKGIEPAGKGKGTGVGFGDGAGTGTRKGPGGGGKVEGDFVSKGSIDTGGRRGEGPKGEAPFEVKVVVGEPVTDGSGLSVEQINRVVKARAGIFRACYQKELNRTPGLAGKLVVAFAIGPDGVVASAGANQSKSTLKNEGVEVCVVANVKRLKFPPPGNTVNVTYPFMFASR